MTNFTSPSSLRQSIHQEQVWLALPMVVAGLMGLVLLLVWVLPQWRQRQALVHMRDAMVEKQGQLDQRSQAVEEARVQLQEAVNRQAQVLALVAPTQQLDTMLTALAEAASSHQVRLVRYEPRRSTEAVNPPLPAPSTGSTVDRGAQPEQASSEADPLQASGLHRQHILITLEGAYTDMVVVLQSLELLQPLAVVHDLKLEGPPVQAGAPSQVGNTRMNLSLAVYSRPPEGGRR